LAARSVGCRWNWAPLHDHENSFGDGPKTRGGKTKDGRASVEGSKRKKRPQPRRGSRLREQEQGNGREKEAFKDWVRFAVTERGRGPSQDGAATGVDAGLARGSGKGKEGRPSKHSASTLLAAGIETWAGIHFLPTERRDYYT
jgi:hypothetical protein